VIQLYVVMDRGDSGDWVGDGGQVAIPCQVQSKAMSASEKVGNEMVMLTSKVACMGKEDMRPTSAQDGSASDSKGSQRKRAHTQVAMPKFGVNRSPCSLHT